jgi:HPt (histidine-containing phosphotransfer) domain-containing protein
MAEVIDWSVFNSLLESVGADEVFLAELIDTYFQDAPAQLTAMQQALIAGNPEDFRRAAHSLKSNSASFGAMEFAQMCKQLEDLGRRGDLQNAAGALAQVIAEYEKVRDALQSARPARV